MNPYRLRVGNTDIIVYGGLDEIGGNLIEVSEGGTRVILDLGISYSRYREYFAWPSYEDSLDTLINLGIAPRVEGLYRGDENSDGLIEGVLLSHAHGDHDYLLPAVGEDIPVYMGVVTHLIEDIKYETIISKPRYLKEGYRDIRIMDFRTGDELNVGGFTIYPIHVDHSIPASYSFIIDTGSTRILYTGDYRMHGHREGERNYTLDMVDKAREFGIDLFISEGTRFHEATLESELEVERRLREIFTSHDGPILLEFSDLDVDRFESIYSAVAEADRFICIDDRRFYKLVSLKEDEVLGEKIIFDKDRTLILSTKARVMRKVRSFIDERERMGYTVIRDWGELRDINLDRSVFLGFIWDIKELTGVLRDYRPIAIFSNSEPHDEESELQLEKIYNWLNIINAPSYRIHCSGHIHPLDLKRIVEDIRPRNLLIIHSENREELMRFLKYK